MVREIRMLDLVTLLITIVINCLVVFGWLVGWLRLAFVLEDIPDPLIEISFGRCYSYG